MVVTTPRGAPTAIRVPTQACRRMPTVTPRADRSRLPPAPDARMHAVGASPVSRSRCIAHGVSHPIGDALDHGPQADWAASEPVLGFAAAAMRSPSRDLVRALCVTWAGLLGGCSPFGD